MENFVTFEHEKTTKIMLYWKLQKITNLAIQTIYFPTKKEK